MFSLGMTDVTLSSTGTVKLFNFHLLKVVSLWRDPQVKWVKIIQIGQNGGQLFADWCPVLSSKNLKLIASKKM